MLKIIKYPNPFLRQKAKTVKQIDDDVKQFTHKLLIALAPKNQNPLGVGLAAPQIGISKRLFLMLMPDKKITTVINPQILKTSRKMLSQLPEKNQFLEGCLSFPGYYGFIDRPIKIKASYQTLAGLTKTARLFPPYSIYFQHENDHLNGILFIDYLKKSKGQLYFGPNREQLKPIKNPF